MSGAPACGETGTKLAGCDGLPRLWRRLMDVNDGRSVWLVWRSRGFCGTYGLWRGPVNFLRVAGSLRAIRLFDGAVGGTRIHQQCASVVLPNAEKQKR